MIDAPCNVQVFPQKDCAPLIFRWILGLASDGKRHRNERAHPRFACMGSLARQKVITTPCPSDISTSSKSTVAHTYCVSTQPDSVPTAAGGSVVVRRIGMVPSGYNRVVHILSSNAVHALLHGWLRKWVPGQSEQHEQHSGTGRTCDAGPRLPGGGGCP
jgi:hypothetical protein